MRFQNLDLNLLVALDQLLRLQSVSRAADCMAMTQSAMSNALSRLRHYFDDPLLVPVGRKMVLTPRAEELAGPVREILVRIEAAVAAPAEFDPGSTLRSITLMVSDYSLSTFVPVLVRNLAVRAPGLRVVIKPQTDVPGVQLEQGDTNLLIAPRSLASMDHPTASLFVDPLVCVLDARNPAANHWNLATFSSLEHVIMEPPNAAESYATRVMREAGLAIKVGVSSFSFRSLPDLVRDTNRVAVIQSRLAREFAIERDGLVFLEPPLDLAPLEQVVQWHAMRGMDPCIIWVRDQVMAAARE